MPALRVAIDLTALEHPVDRPIARSVQVRFTEALIQHAPSVAFTVLTRPQTRAALAHLDAPNARQVALAEPSQYGRVLARSQARLWKRVQRSRLGDRFGWLRRLRPERFRWRQGRLAGLGVDVVFCPFASSGSSDPTVPMVVAIDDLQHVSHPYLLSSNERIARSQALGATLRRAARIVCSTPSLRDAALQSDGVTAERVVTIPPGRLLVDPLKTQSPVAGTTTVPPAGLADRPFFLLVADLEPRHGYRGVLTALAIYRGRHPDDDTRLVCVGGPDAEVPGFEIIAGQMGLGASVLFAGALDRDQTSALLTACRAVIFASLYETVGEIVLQAMQQGRAVLCSKIPGLSELVGDAALTFDPHRPAELADALERIGSDVALLDHLAQQGRARVAEAYLGVFREAIASCPPSR